jgi:hypothetical protein
MIVINVITPQGIGFLKEGYIALFQKYQACLLLKTVSTNAVKSV